MRRVAIVALCITAVAALGACAKSPTPGANPTDSGGASGIGTLGEGSQPSSSATPAATTAATPTPTATGGGGPTLPAPHSSLPNKAGYAWINQIAANYNASTSYQFTSSGGVISVSHIGTGNYSVVFGGLGTAGGVAQAQSYGSTSNYCNVTSWNAVGSDQEINVNCFAAAGTPADTMFVVSFAVGSQGAARFSYLWADQPGNTAKYHPEAAYRYDAVDAGLLTVARISTGRYEVYVPAAGSCQTRGPSRSPRTAPTTNAS